MHQLTGALPCTLLPTHNTTGAAQLGKLLECSSTLTELNLKSNNLSNSGCACLSAGLARSPSLKALDLCENAVGPEGAVELANGVQVRQKLIFYALLSNVGLSVGACACRFVSCAPRFQ